MASYVERVIAEQLLKLPESHPEHAFLSEELPRFEALRRSEGNLLVEWQRQAQNFLDLGFHTELGHADTEKGKQAYLDSLPKFQPQPESYKGKFDLSLLVETRIAWERQAELAGIDISDYLTERVDRIVEWEGNLLTTPKTAYSGWFNSWGQRFELKISPSNARDQIKPDERGGGLLEGVAMQIAHPEFNKDSKYFDLIGDQVGSVRVACLRRWDDRPELGANWGGDANAYFRPLVRGSEIVTG